MLHRARIFVVLYFAAAVLPLVAMVLHLPDVGLFGQLPPATRPAWAFADFRTEGYQTRFTAWFEQNHGYRDVSIWLDNTVLYHAFGETKPNARVQIGKRGTLFEYDDIVHFNKSGAYIPPPSAVDKLADGIAAVQAAFRLRHRALVPVFLPSKTTFYRDDVPPLWTRDLGEPRPSDEGVYKATLRALQARHVVYVDEIARLAESPEPHDRLWAPQARHISGYAGCFVVRDTLAAYATLTETAAIDYPCQYERKPTEFMSVDVDLYRLLNAWGVSQDPDLRSDRHDPHLPAAPATAPNAVWIASSYGWVTMYDARDSGRLGELHLDYYNHTMYDSVGRKLYDVRTHREEWLRTLMAADLDVLELNETYSVPSDYFGEDAIAAILAALDASPAAP